MLAAAAFAALVCGACGVRSPEEQVLEQFFRDTRLIDSTILAKTATVSFDPRTQGSVQQFHITAISESRAAAPTTEDVTIAAQVRTPEGSTVARTLIATLQKRAEDGRWIVTAIR